MKTLIICDYDDTLFDTDGFFSGALETLRKQGDEGAKVAGALDAEVTRRRNDKNSSSSAGYDIMGEVRNSDPKLENILAEGLAAGNEGRIFKDAARFYGSVKDREDIEFNVWTRGEEAWQKAKIAGTVFKALEEEGRLNTFLEPDKIARIIERLGDTATGDAFTFNDIVYNRLVMIDNDKRYFKGFEKLRERLGAAAVGFQVHRDNPRFSTGADQLPDGVTAIKDFNDKHFRQELGLAA